MNLSRLFHAHLAVGFLAASAASAQTIAQWTFNSAPADANPFTGTTTPSTGSGTFAGVGGVSTGIAPGAPSDPAAGAGDNSAAYSSAYPITNVGSGTRGVRFGGSTLGASSIALSYSQFAQDAASAWWRLEYTVNGVDFTSNGLPASTPGGPGEYRFPQSAADGWQDFAWDLSGIGGAGNNANFAFRAVAIFAPGTNNYVNASSGNASGYTPGATVRFDMVTIAGAGAPQQGACCNGAACQAAVAPEQCLGAGRQFLAGSACNAPGQNKNPCCKANFNRLSGITVQDLFDYLGAWFARELGADLNGAAPAPAGVTVQDLFDYLGAWFDRGCS